MTLAGAAAMGHIPAVVAPSVLVVMKSLRNLSSLRPSSLPSGSPVRRWLDRCLTLSLVFGMSSAALWACGSSPEVVKQPEPVKVNWSKAGSAEDEEARGSGDDTTATGTEVDLDAPKESTKEPAAAPAPPPEPEPAAEEPAVEAAAEPAEEAPAEEAVEEEAAAEPAVVPLGKEIRAAVRGKEPKEKPAKKKPAAKPKKAPPEEPAAAAPTYSGSDGCRAKSFSIPRVAEACARNGRSGAKSVMKEAIGKALAGGASLKCADCHSDMRSYALKGDAVAQLKKWLGS